MACQSSCANIDGQCNAGRRTVYRLLRQALRTVVALSSLLQALPAAADEFQEYSVGGWDAAGAYRGELHKRRLKTVLRPRFSMPSISIPQLPSSAGPRFPEALAGPGQSTAAGMSDCPRWMLKQMICTAFDSRAPTSALPDALIAPPNAETVPVITAIGIPVIEGAPPIVILGDHQTKAMPRDAPPGARNSDGLQ